MTIVDEKCLLCTGEAETIEHLYFKCPVSAELSRAIADWLQIRPFPSSYSTWMRWLSHVASQKTVKAKLVVAAVNALVYHIWKLRNDCLHKMQRPDVQSLLFRIKREVTLRVLGCDSGVQTQIVRQILCFE